jgi:hypothetical protein
MPAIQQSMLPQSSYARHRMQALQQGSMDSTASPADDCNLASGMCIDCTTRHCSISSMCTHAAPPAHVPREYPKFTAVKSSQRAANSHTPNDHTPNSLQTQTHIPSAQCCPTRACCVCQQNRYVIPGCIMKGGLWSCKRTAAGTHAPEQAAVLQSAVPNMAQG